MTRAKALEFLNQNVQNRNLVKHCLATEVIMRALARRFNQDEAQWGLVGLLHDIDYEKTKDNPAEHSLAGAEMLRKWGANEEICRAVKVHNEVHGISPETLLEKAIFATDPLTGLIVAAVLVLPSKKIADLAVQNILNRFQEKSFARGANREIIKKCEEYLNLSLEEFVTIGLEAMKNIHKELEL